MTHSDFYFQRAGLLDSLHNAYKLNHSRLNASKEGDEKESILAKLQPLHPVPDEEKSMSTHELEQIKPAGDSKEHLISDSGNKGDRSLDQHHLQYAANENVIQEFRPKFHQDLQSPQYDDDLQRSKIQSMLAQSHHGHNQIYRPRDKESVMNHQVLADALMNRLQSAQKPFIENVAKQYGAPLRQPEFFDKLPQFRRDSQETLSGQLSELQRQMADASQRLKVIVESQDD